MMRKIQLVCCLSLAICLAFGAYAGCPFGGGGSKGVGSKGLGGLGVKYKGKSYNGKGIQMKGVDTRYGSTGGSSSAKHYAVVMLKDIKGKEQIKVLKTSDVLKDQKKLVEQYNTAVKKWYADKRAFKKSDLNKGEKFTQAKPIRPNYHVFKSNLPGLKNASKFKDKVLEAKAKSDAKK